MRAHNVPVRAVAPIVVEDFIAWCEERGEDPEQARALYSAHRFADGEAISWPPARNESCWCGSQRKYKKCCGPAPAAPMHDPERSRSSRLRSVGAPLSGGFGEWEVRDQPAPTRLGL